MFGAGWSETEASELSGSSRIGDCDALVAVYAGKRFENESGRESANQGYPRRLELMKQCIFGSVEPFPLRISWVPSRFNILDVMIQLQAFVVSARGCTDNLDHVCVREKGLMGEDGVPLAGSQVGLGSENKAVLDRLSPKVMNSHVFQAGALADTLPGTLEVGEMDAGRRQPTLVETGGVAPGDGLDAPDRLGQVGIRAASDRREYCRGRHPADAG